MDYNISMIRGDTLSFGLELEELEQELGSAYFSCKKNYADKDYVFQKSLLNGIERREGNVYAIRVAPEDTENIDVGNYYYDLQVGVNSDVFTILHGVLMVGNEVTRED